MVNSRSESEVKVPTIYRKRAKAAPARPSPRPTGPAVANAAPPVEVDDELALAPEAVEEAVLDLVKVLPVADDEPLPDPTELVPVPWEDLVATELVSVSAGTDSDETPAGRVTTAG